MNGRIEGMKVYTQYEIYAIIDETIKQETTRKNEYIQKNGYSHADVLRKFDSRISVLSELYGKFKGNGTW